MATNPAFEFFLAAYKTVHGLTYEIVADLITNGPHYYVEWWISLLRNAPEHLVIETALCLFIIWLVFIRKTVDPVKSSKESLSKKEVEWLIDTWQPEPLVPSASADNDVVSDTMLTIESVDGNYLHVKGVRDPVLNVASYDFLGMSQELSIKTKAVEALDYYGCGSCGPRGFYGTIDVHLNFEHNIAKFMGTEEAISYSDSASTVTSVISAFAKKGDLLIVDEAVSEPVLAGLNLSRSLVHFFRHNDVEHLQSILDSIAKDDKKLRRDTKQQRRFIVVEGLYRNTGDLCPLPEILALKEKYFYRLMMDESTSFGAVGATGRGVTEHFGVKITDVEIIMIAMDTTLASVGGVCIGSSDIVDHQRLSGAGYCFSAAAPPFLSSVAIEALRIMEDEPELLAALTDNAAALRTAVGKLKGVELFSDEVTPVIHLTLAKQLDTPEEEAAVVTKLAAYCVAHGVAIVANTFGLQHASAKALRPTLTLNAHAKLSKKEITKVGTVLGAALKACKL